MARPCSVCAHRNRGDIDRRLAVQVVNVKQLAAEFGLGRDAVARHRSKHLPQFLPAFQARADALTLDSLQAEAQRLYLISLDALARAEAGVLVDIDAEGTAHYRVSSTAVARLIREARTGLSLLASLAVDGETPVDSPRSNDQLDERISAALDRALAQVGSSNVTDAEIVEDDVPVAPREAAARLAIGAPTLGPGAGSAPGPARNEYPLDSETPPGGSGEKGTHAADEPATTDWATRRASLVERARAAGHPISAAATREELKALGYDVEAIDQAIALHDAPERDGYTYRMGESEPPR